MFNVNFNRLEVEAVKSESGRNAFSLSPPKMNKQNRSNRDNDKSSAL